MTSPAPEDAHSAGAVESRMHFAWPNPARFLRGRSAPQVLLRRLLDPGLTLLVIIYLTLFGLIMAERGREHVPAPLGSVAKEAVDRTIAYFTAHPKTYVWHRVEQPAVPLVLQTFARSAGLLLAALGFAAIVGVLLGLAMARRSKRTSSTVMLIASVLGISTPSFLLAMLLWVVNIQIYRRFNTPALPPTGFGWDGHLIMPMLVLAVRPLAQITQVTYVTLIDVLGQDYLRTAHAKGLSDRLVLMRHAIPNIRNPVLTTLATSLRFSLASLVVVEFFFLWPGAGSALLQAINLGMTTLIVDLIVCLGLSFLLINVILEVLSPMLDPRLKDSSAATAATQQGSAWREGLAGAGTTLVGLWRSLRDLARGGLPLQGSPSPPGPRGVPKPRAVRDVSTARDLGVAGAGGNRDGVWENFGPSLQKSILLLHLRRSSPLPPLPAGLARIGRAGDAGPPALGTSKRATRAVLRNPLLLVSTVLVLGFLVLALYGDRMVKANPYQIHGVMMINGKIGAPPFRPSSVFPWGTDQVGRDVQALVLSGAKLTLGLALLATAARVLLGVVLGLFAGWWHGGRWDRLVNGAIGVLAAFPVTLFAMLLIQGIGIQQGLWVFIVALCVVGWAEVAQLVRRQTISIKPQLYIEAARSIGVPPTRILGQHVVPQLLPTLLVLGVLEMGAVLMLLAELGFLNVFLGGGYKVTIGEVGAMQPVIAYFSDVPEWGAMLANIRDWWRSYPWMAWYAGLAFFLAILTFNLFGEGLRRFLSESRVNVSRLLNRYTVLGGVAATVVIVLLLRSSTPLGVYQSQARKFDASQALQDVQVLTSPELQGRETGTSGAQAAAEYIAGRMEQIGLFPAGENNTFIQTSVAPRIHLEATPRLEKVDADGNVLESFNYRKDFVERIDYYRDVGEGAIVGLATGADPETEKGGDPYRLGSLDLSDKILLIPEVSDKRIYIGRVAGSLTVSDDRALYERKYLFPSANIRDYPTSPAMYITSATADRLLATTGSSLAKLRQTQDRVGPDGQPSLQPGEAALTPAGDRVRLSIPIAVPGWDDVEEKYYNVIGFIPGSGASMEGGSGTAAGALDSQVILITAYYDGLGHGPDGTIYPGANDNASGVATMLELARLLKQSPYAPKKTVVFVAWTGGERQEGLSVKGVMNAKLGFGDLTVESVLELSGVGAGAGEEIALGDGSSYRLVRLFQEAAGRLGIASTTRGRGPHYGMPTVAGFGGRDAMTLYLSWSGSDDTAHTARDTYDSIDPKKLEQVGRATLLLLQVLSREVDY